MNDLEHIDSMIESLADLALAAKSLQADPKPALPSLGKALADFSSLPSEALFLGLAADGLPVLLDLHDPTPGPLLVSSDSGGGKTAFLQMIARAVEILSEPQDLQFGVLTSKPEEWNDFTDSKNCVGIYKAETKEAAEFLISLAKWTHSNKGQTGFVLLFVDDLEAASRMTEGQQDLRWLLARGPSRHVWSVVTLNSSDALKVFPWLNFFRSRVLGYIENPIEAQALCGDADAKMETLTPGTEFSIREGQGWLKFWLLAEESGE
jgi:hypothetical protein